MDCVNGNTRECCKFWCSGWHHLSGSESSSSEPDVVRRWQIRGVPELVSGTYDCTEHMYQDHADSEHILQHLTQLGDFLEGRCPRQYWLQKLLI